MKGVNLQFFMCSIRIQHEPFAIAHLIVKIPAPWQSKPLHDRHDRPAVDDQRAVLLKRLVAQVLKGAHAARCKRIPALPAREGQRAAGVDPRLIIGAAAELRIILSFKLSS